MPVTPKRRCPETAVSDSLNDSLEKRIKRISIEGNIGEFLKNDISRVDSNLLMFAGVALDSFCVETCVFLSDSE